MFSFYIILTKISTPKLRNIVRSICDNSPTMTRGDIIMDQAAAITFKEFRTRYNTEDACRTELFHLRFSDGFVCTVCGRR